MHKEALLQKSQRYALLNSDRVKVCKTMFINTLSILKKGSLCSNEKRSNKNASEEDKRGDHLKNRFSIRRHIKSFAEVDSHY